MAFSKRSTLRTVVFEIGDIQTDGRCRNIAESIMRWGSSVTFIGPADGDGGEELNGITIIRLRVITWLGSKVMYMHYWIRSFWRGVNVRPSLIVAEDLYSLPAALAVKFFTGAKILYDSKELYFAVASLHNRPVTQWFWTTIERLGIRYVDGVITSGERDSDLIAERYGIPHPVTINNHPPRRLQKGDAGILRKTYGIPDEFAIFLYQGWLLRGRGLFHLIEFTAAIDRAFLVIMGDGSIRRELENVIREKFVSDRVLFTGALPYEKMLEYTPGADIGCALIEDLGMSYRHARPNKMFEYIQAGVPVLVSSMAAMKEVVDKWQVGIAVDPGDKSEIITAAKKFIEDRDFYEKCVENCEKAATVFHWGEEEGKLCELLDSIFVK